jgi:hypothetical protein
MGETFSKLTTSANSANSATNINDELKKIRIEKLENVIKTLEEQLKLYNKDIEKICDNRTNTAPAKIAINAPQPPPLNGGGRKKHNKSKKSNRFKTSKQNNKSKKQKKSRKLKKLKKN